MAGLRRSFTLIGFRLFSLILLCITLVFYRREESDQKLSQWFDPPTCRAIKTIPLPRCPVEDRLIWHASPDGVFSVKSAYHLAVSLEKRRGVWKSTVSWMDRSSWIRVWEADIPPKLRVFLWQILNRILPTTEALIGKQAPVNPRCPVCWASSETMEHLFLECPVARALWDYSGLAHLGEGLPRHTFPLFFKRLLTLISQPTVIMVVVAILWRIWRSLNWVVFEGKQFGFPALMRQFQQQYEEWVRLPAERGLSRGSQEQTRQDRDSAEGVVCMWDGAVRVGSHSAGGVVVLTPDREVLMAGGGGGYSFLGLMILWLWSWLLFVRRFCGVNHSDLRRSTLKEMLKLSLIKSTRRILEIVG
ncbi:unnamed protein product [Linum trigynum]|uniref:Reverse transcriptase zinc-binding domain-containing protein n=1 Tax=Linum trigynum TaxID=586398 RepID=A0AAV2DX60_9ROSI